VILAGKGEIRMSSQPKHENWNDGELFSIAQIAMLFGLSERIIRQRIAGTPSPSEYFSIAEVAARWRCSRGTVYSRLRAIGAKVLDFSPSNKRGKKVVAAKVVFQIEQSKMKRLR
jgi:hypothetical protein